MIKKIWNGVSSILIGLWDKNNLNTIRYFTEGDANNIQDSLSVHYKNIIGKPVFTIPYSGFVPITADGKAVQQFCAFRGTCK